MLPNTALYAAKKRKKPVQKIPKPPPADGVKSNPSKRHRDRLNGELDKLTSLLPFPEDVRSRLDKLSVLRLSVGYLKVKTFFNATIKHGQNGSSSLFGRNGQDSSSNTSSSCPLASSIDGVTFSEGDLLLQALNGFVLVVTAEGYVFYTSPTILDFLGFHQSDVVHQSVFELIHTDDRALFRRQLHFALDPQSGQKNEAAASSSEQSSAEVSTSLMAYDPQLIPPENSSFLERNFCCRFRCLLDNSSGFLALNFCGRLKYVHGQNRRSEDGTLLPPQLAFFSIATPLQPPSILEIRTKTLIFQTKHKLDFRPQGIDTRGKVVLGFSEEELCVQGSGYHFIHAADMMYCAENHVRMMKTGDSGFTYFRLLTKIGSWIWVQANARVVFKGGKPDFIVAQQRALSNEEGEEQLRVRRLQLPFNFTGGESSLYDLAPTLDVPDPCSAPKQRKLDDSRVSPDSLLGYMLSQDQSIYCEHNSANTLNSLNDAAFKDTHATVNVPGDVWQRTPPKQADGSSGKSEASVQEMMETLQQILGDSELTESLDIEVDELKSWESALLKMNEVTDDLGDIISQDILSYVEEQLEKEGSFKLPEDLELQNRSQNQNAEQDFSWLVAQDQLPKTMKLSHMDVPQTSGPNGQLLNQIGMHQSVTSTQLQNHLSMQPVRNNSADLLSFRQPSQPHTGQPLRTCPQPQLPPPSIPPHPNSVFSQWTTPHGNIFPPTYVQKNVPSAVSHPPQTGQNNWLERQQRVIANGHQQVNACVQPSMGYQKDCASQASLGCNDSVFRPAETSNQQLPFHLSSRAPPLAAQSSCMFSSVPSPVPVNGVQLSQATSCQQLHPNPPFYYVGFSGGGSLLATSAISSPDAAVLPHLVTPGSNPEELPPHPCLTFNQSCSSR
ncbi:aryl hydrocarbon receptor-like [Neosynchiropus ocellatus]